MNITTESPELSLPSPVTWRVALWALIALAVNSMAQPSGRFCGLSVRYRLYLRSSPLICLADAISMLGILLANLICLRISVQKGIRLLLLARFTEGDTYHGHNSQLAIQEWKRYTWPRWLFFVLSALPAAIKLGSFTGVPWTQVWGMMFVSSFVTAEIIPLLSTSSILPREYCSVNEALGYSALEWEGVRYDELRSKVDRLTASIAFFQTSIFVLAFAAQTVVLIWAIVVIWLELRSIMNASELATNLNAWFEISLFCIGGSMLLVFGIMRMLSFGHILRVLEFNQVGRSILAALALSRILPRRRHSDLDRLEAYNQTSGFLLLIMYAFYCLHWLVSYISKSFPKISIALLIDKAPEERDLLLAQRENCQPIDECAWVAFCFFYCNLTFAILWYALKYNPTGTINPSWTEVFG